MGAMSPVSIPATLTQQMAEALTGVALSQLVRPGLPVIFGSFLSNIDMQSGSPCFGTPESAIGLLCTGQIARRFALVRPAAASPRARPRRPGRVRGVDDHALTFLAGINWVMHAAGWLEGGLVMSYEKFVQDVQVLEMLQQQFTLLEIDEASLAFDAHDEVRHGGHFLGAAHTMERFRTCFYRPFLNSSDNYERLDANGEGCRARARDVARTKLDEYEAPPLDDAVREELTERDLPPSRVD